MFPLARYDYSTIAQLNICMQIQLSRVTQSDQWFRGGTVYRSEKN